MSSNQSYKLGKNSRRMAQSIDQNSIYTKPIINSGGIKLEKRRIKKKLKIGKNEFMMGLEPFSSVRNSTHIQQGTSMKAMANNFNLPEIKGGIHQSL
jgi:hypothetical protein